jgi:HK97 family phage major capsid protein
MFPGRSQPADGPRRGLKSIGQLFVESEAFTGYKKGMKDGPVLEIDMDKEYGHGALRYGLKALFDTTGWEAQSIRLPEVISPAEQAPTIADLFPQGQTSQPAIPYMEETTTDNQAQEVAEGDTKQESTIALEEKSSPVRKIATSLPVTEESFEDVPAAESYIDGRLRLFIAQREDSQLLVGDGVAPNLKGIFNTPDVQTQGQAADTELDAIFKAMTKVQVGSQLAANALVINPLDWETVRLSKDGVNGGYMLGPAIGASDPRPWGLQTVVTTACPLGTALVAATRLGAQIFRRTELSLRVGYVDDQFVRNTRTIIVEERLAFVVFRPAAFCMLDFSS